MLENRSYSLILLFHERLEDYGVRINYQSVYHGLMQDGRFEDLLLNYDLLQAKGVSIDYETVGNNGSMLMVTCSGTAVEI